MPNVKTRNRFTSDSKFIAEMQWAFEKDADSVRRGYFELVLELEELLWTERLLREKVLHGDRFSTSDRLWGCQLADYIRGRTIDSVPFIPPSCMDSVGSEMTQHYSKWDLAPWKWCEIIPWKWRSPLSRKKSLLDGNISDSSD